MSKTKMIEIETNSAEGRPLDWLIANILGNTLAAEQIIQRPMSYVFRPSTAWGVGGPILDEKAIMFCADAERGGLMAYLKAKGTAGPKGFGATHLEAAMRCVINDACGNTARVPSTLFAD